MMPICIAGMHRSGTSLLSRLLNATGVYLGPDADILPASPSNPEGHWENIRFLSINEALLAQAKCAWDFVRPLEDGWHLAPCYDSVREDAARLVATFAGRDPWGWKDPRNSLTLPFWKRLLPELKVIVCIRNPLEVAMSLHERERMPVADGIRLWIDYYNQLTNDLPSNRRLVIHYHSLLYNTQTELARALQFADISVNDETRKSVASIPKQSLRHHFFSLANLLESHHPAELVRTYLDWCFEAGSSCYQEMRGDDEALPCLQSLLAENAKLKATCAVLERYVCSMEAKSAESEQYARSLEIEHMTTSPDCSFVLAVERGKLEPQAILLVESLRRFGGAWANCPVYVVSPRPSRQIGPACREALQNLGVQAIVEPLVSPEEAYGPVARLAACAWAERNLACEILVALDDDLFFAAEPDFCLLGADLFARPVDVKGMCTSGSADPFNAYWQAIADACGVDYDDIPWLETTVDRARVKASYNAGMVAVRRERGLFQEAQRMFRVLRAKGLAPRNYGTEPVFASTGYVGAEATRWWGSAQAVLSLAATRLKAGLCIAPPVYNIPAHLADSWKDYGATFTLKNAVLVHYHWLLGTGYIKKDIVLPGGGDLPGSVLEWLKSRTPLVDNDTCMVA